MERVLHAGFHKTGSTFLQRNVFPKLDGVQYFGGQIKLASLPLPPPGITDGVLLFSSEATCGYPYPIAEEFSIERISSCVELLCVNKIIIVRRRFLSWCLSLYFQTLSEGESWSMEEFLEKNKKGLLSWREASSLIRSWARDCGIEYLEIEYDLLLEKPEEAVHEICVFIGSQVADVNYQKKVNSSRYGCATIWLFRRLNIINRINIFRGLMKILRLTPKKIIQGRVGDFLDRASSRKLSESDVAMILS